RKGVAVHTGKAVADCAGKELVLDSGESLRSEAYLVACGRRPVFPEGSFAKEHLVQKDGRLVVDDRYMTSVDGVYAIGDCVTGPMLAHKAAFDAHQVSRILSGRAKGMPREYSHIPAVVFSDPPLAAIGNLSGERVKVPLASIGRAYCDDLTGGFVSLYIQEGRVAGGVVIASRAEDILGALTIAVSSRVRVEDLAATVFAHPTYAEILSEAARRFLAAQ
ncbi:MAG: FAD-dependent oxidoreductase, partial [Nanoarchaeota archaeon]